MISYKSHGKKQYLFIQTALVFVSVIVLTAQTNLEINELDYFEMPGLNITVFSDFYPGGHLCMVTDIVGAINKIVS